MTYFFVDKNHVKKEKEKAREAKKSRWWHQKCVTGICHYCGKKFQPKQLTMDHVVPLSRGGTTTPGNVVPACLECNKNKSVDTPVDIFFKKNEE
jgi:5-methylcytosine-specific restriction protein A